MIIKNIFKRTRVHRRVILKAIIVLPFTSCLLSKTQSRSSSMEATIQINLKHIIGNVNRKTLGAGLVFTPFKEHESIISKMFGKGTSARLWPGQLTDEDFNEKKSLIVSLAPSKLLAFPERSSLENKKASYESENKNNLETYQQPSKIIQDITWILSRLTQVGYPPKGQFLYWEAWNEPQHEQNGLWDADLFANYVNDLAARIKKLRLPIKVGAPLNMDDSDWNEKLCKRLNSNVVDFLVTHYYSVWKNVEVPSSSFLARAGLGITLRERVKRDLKLTKTYGKNNWTLHCSEWNLHPPPPNYDPPYDTTRDMAAALYALSAVKIYLEEGIESAQYFLISSQQHFGAISIYEDGTVKVHATGAAFMLMNECLHGKLLKIELKSPEYTLKMNQKSKDKNNYLESYQVPFIEAVGCQWKNGTIKILLGNKHETKSLNPMIQGIPLPEKVTIQTISDDMFKDKDISEPTKALIQSKSLKNMTLSPKSITAITINA
jgi:hypothetical protein